MALTIKVTSASQKAKFIKLQPGQKIVLQRGEHFTLEEGKEGAAVKYEKIGHDIVIRDDQGRSYTIDGSQGTIEVSDHIEQETAQRTIQLEISTHDPVISSVQTTGSGAVDGGAFQSGGDFFHTLSHAFGDVLGGYTQMGLIGLGALGGGVALVQSRKSGGSSTAEPTQWSVSADTGTEAGSGFITFTISRSGDASQAASIDFATTGGTAISNVDYTAVAQTISFAAGETSKIITVNIVDDSVPEVRETVIGTLSNATIGTIQTSTASGGIVDNDFVQWTIAATDGPETSGGFITYTITRVGDLSQTASINFATSGGAATPDIDYVATQQTVNFLAGEGSKTVQVAIIDDADVEPNETVVGSITMQSIGIISSNNITAKILDDDQSVWSVSSVGNTEGTAHSLLFTVSRTGDVASAATIDFATGGGSATSGSDYTAVSQTLSFSGGETSKTIWVPILDDANGEQSETVLGLISNASAGNIDTSSSLATITDDDQINWSIATVANADEGASQFGYLVSRTGDSSTTATIDFATTGGVALPGIDYVPVQQTLTFAAGETQKFVWVNIINDSIPEPNETVVASISNPSVGNISVLNSSGTLITGSAYESILDNDQSIWGITSLSGVVEGPNVRVGYTVYRVGDVSTAATIDFATAGGTATAGVDYTPVIQTLNFAAGEAGKTIWVDVLDDSVIEAAKTIAASISNVTSGTISTATATPTLYDNDQSLWSIAVANTSLTNVAEASGNKMVFTVSRIGDISTAATIDVSSTGGTATAGVDFVALNQTLSFAVGESQKTVYIDIIGDTAPEPSETVLVSINNASSGTLSAPTATETIQDNDQMIWTVASSHPTINAANELPGNSLSYVVSRVGDISTAATIEFATAGGTATAGVDYAPVVQTLNFAAGEANKVVLVNILDDLLAEPNETLTVIIDNASSGTIATTSTSQTILENDSAVWTVSVSASSDEDGGNRLGYVVSRAGDINQTATIDFATTGGTATAGVDYTPVNQTLSFAAGETNKVIWVDVLGDTTPEYNETVAVTIRDPSYGAMTTTSTSASILDNDQSIWSIGALNSSIASIDEVAGNKLFYTILRSGALGAATIEFQTIGGTATAGVDYTPVIQTLTFAAGETTKVVSVDILGDSVPETNETVVAVIDNASTGSIVVSGISQTILDNDQSVWNMTNITNSEEDGGARIGIVVTRSGDISSAATIDIKTGGGSATPVLDYVPLDQTLNFAAGEATKVVYIDLVSDTLAEPNEPIFVGLANASIGTIISTALAPSILDNDQPVWAISGVASADEDGGNRLGYLVSRTGDISSTATIDFATAGGTATAGVDFTALSQTLSFASGEISKIVWVDILGDTNPEPDEGVMAVIRNASIGTIATGYSSLNILENDKPVWNISTYGSVDESAGSKIGFQIVRTGGYGQTATIDFATANGTATAGVDYTPVLQTLSFAAGEMMKVVWVDILPDSNPELNESLLGTIANASIGTILTTNSSGTLLTGSTTVNILENDQSVWSLAAANAANAIVDEASGNRIAYVVSRTGNISTAATIDFSTAGGTATAGVDYTYLQQTLTFAAGETSKLVFVDVIGDSIPEPTETVVGNISNPSSGVIATFNAAQTILDNDQSVWTVAVGSTSLNIVDEATGNKLVYLISRTGDVSSAATVDVATIGGTAAAGINYTPVLQTLNFAAGETSKVVCVDILGDNNPEPNETVTLGITNVSTGTVVTGFAAQTILDNDQSVWSVVTAYPTVISTDEDGGNRLAYVVSRTGGINSVATIDVKTAGGTATAGVDYTPVNQTLTFAAGETNKLIWVDLLGDSLEEPNESVTMTIGNASTGTIIGTSTTQTILDNDQSVWSINNLSNGDGEGGARLGFTVSRTGHINSAETIDFVTTGGTATAGVDYTPVSQTLSFAAGETSKVIWITIASDLVPELSDTIVASIANPSGGTLSTSAATQTLIDNDQSLWTIVTVANGEETLGGKLSFVVSRSGDHSLAATIEFETMSGTATAGIDYTPVLQTLNFSAGETTKIVSVDVLADSLQELNETLIGRISNVSTGSIVNSGASGTIVDNDQSLWTLAVLLAADDDGGNRLAYSITRSGDISSAANIDFKTAGGTATAGVDYTPLQQTLNFAAGETAKVVWVDILSDSNPEPNETVVGTIANASTGTIITGATSQTILDNDQSLWTVAAVANSDEDGGNRLAFTVTRAGGINSAATIDFATIGGYATAGVDYTPVLQTLNFAAGETVKVVLVDLIGDSQPETDESLMVGIGNQSTGLTVTATATTTILDNDQSLWSIAALTAADEDGGRKLSYTISRTGDISLAATITFLTTGGTATAGVDYTAVQQILNFAAGETMKVVSVDILPDVLPEGNETVMGTIIDPSYGTIVAASLSNTILTNDQSIWSIASSSVMESAGNRIFFAITRTGDINSVATIDFSTDAGTATPGVDYTPLQQTLTFSSGETFKNVFVDIASDSLPELSETIVGVITNASTGTISAAATAASLLDDDQSIWGVAVALSTLVTIDESAGSKLAFLVSRNGDYSSAASIDFMTAGGTATAGVDYTSVSQTLNFAAGETQKLVWVDILSDSVAESNDTVSVIIQNASTGTIVTGAASQTILDNDQSVWSVASILTPMDEATDNRMGFTVSRTGDTSMAASIVVASAGGTATAGVDYTPLQQTLNFAAGETIKVVYLDMIGDATLEPNETVYMTIGNASSGTILTSNVAQTISDNDIVTWALSAGTNPNEDGGGRVYANIVRGGDISQTATIDVITAGGTAIGGQDFTPLKQTLTFAAGETIKSFHFNVLGDTLPELNETVVVALANASVGTIVTSTSAQTIVENDQDLWNIAISTSSDEDGGNKMAFAVSRTGNVMSSATIDFATIGGTAIGGLDYTPLQQTLTFAAGETIKLVTINMLADTTPEVNETIIGCISNNSTGTLVTAATTGTIYDNDLMSWSVAAIASSDEDGGNRIAYTVTRTGSLASAATITFATAGGTATAGVDYTAISQSLAFAAGETIKTVWVDIAGDSIAEANETIVGVIGNVSAGTISTASATGTITDNDLSRTHFGISVLSNNVYESSGSVAYLVSRTGDLSSSQTISYSMGTGTATAGVDYTAISGSITFAQGEGSKVISLDLLNDATVEASETITVQLSNATMGTITTASASATILDDDSVAATSYAVTVTSNNAYESTGTIGFTITRAGDVSAATTTYFRTNGGTATAGSDYTAIASRTLNWGIGETLKIVFVTLTNDAIAETSETIIGQIATDSGFTAGLSTATATMLDDDSVAATGYTIAVTSTNVIESTGAVAFTLARTGDVSAATTTYFRTNGGTAQTDGSDYTLIGSQTLNWAAGEATKVVFVTLTNDSTTEGNETIIGQIATNAGFTTGLSTATLTVLDDDLYTATAGVADTLTTGTVSGSYKGGYLISAGDMNDTVTIGGAQQAFTNIDLGTGNDTLNAGSTPANFIVTGAHYIGGSGVDTLAFLGTTAFNFSGTTSTGDMVKGFEVLSLSGAGNQIVNLSLQDVLEMTTGNSVANTLKITGNAGDTLNLQVAGKALNTIANGGTVTDVDGSTFSAVTSTQGASGANDVTISGQVYDVYVYNTPSSTVTLLIDTDIIVNSV